MTGTLITIASFIFVLGVLVFVHELGHFWAAKRVGIRVLKFQLGFDPTVASIRRGDTEYSLGILPLGGYVKMAGEHGDPGSATSPDEFPARSRWERFQVLIMGPVMNLALAYVFLAVVLSQGAERFAFEDQPPVVGVVVPDSPAARAGVRVGDRFVSVGGRAVSTWEGFLMAVGAKTRVPVEIAFDRDGRTTAVTVTPVGTRDGRLEIGDVGVLPDAHPRIRQVVAGEAAERAGLKVGDVVVAVDGRPMTFSGELKQAIASHPGQPITLALRRDGAELSLVATPAARGGSGLLGISIGDDTVSVKPGILGALRLSAQKNIEYAGMILHTLGGLFTRQTSPKQLMGPVAIAQLSGESAQLGWVALMGLMAQISLNLGLLNLMPIPVLDGGHILILGLEALARRDFTVKVKERLLMAGFVILLSLMATTLYNDLTRVSWIARLIPWK